jgi:iduronate 2-sulfatase
MNPLRLLYFLSALLFIFSAQPTNAAEKKPNVLFIAVDDLNTQVGCYGNSVVKTPNIDRLAKMGVRFDRAYCNYPICNPSRTSMLSGLYPEHTQVFGNNTPPRTALGTNVVFTPELFKQNGYFTAGIGKIFHGSFMDTVKWDVWINPKDADDEEGGDGKKEKSAGKKQRADKGDASKVPFPWRATDNKDEQEPDGQIARKAVQVLEENKDKPFFLAVGFHKPHTGHVAPKKYFDMYPPEKIELVKEPPIASQGIPEIARSPKYFPNLTDAQKQEIISHYYAATTFMDAQLGKVLDAMDRLKLWDNTIVVFWGDHGWHHGEHGGMWAKVTVMEEVARVPFIIIAPEKKKDAVSSRVVETVDFYPTLAEFCGLTKPNRLDGRSILPLLDDPKREWNETALCVVNRGRNGLGHSLRSEKWTYTEWPDGSAQLYNHDKDPHEYVNLAKDPKHANTVSEMKKLLAQKRIGLKNISSGNNSLKKKRR